MTITTFTQLDIGNNFEIFVRVFTEAGDYSDSNHTFVILGDVPQQPPTSPRKNAVYSNSTSFLIQVDTLASSLYNGLQVDSYSIEIDDGLGGPFQALTGFPVLSLATSEFIYSGINKGKTYRLRYRAHNTYGWGPYSVTSQVLASQKPSMPVNAPTILSTTDS